MSDAVFVGVRAAALESAPAVTPYSRVILYRDRETHFTAGDDSGQTYEKTIPSATQAMAEDILAKLSGAVLRPIAARHALLDPAAELGDGVTVGGIYSQLGKIVTTYDAELQATLDTPFEDEFQDEFPYRTSTEKIYGQLEATRSAITKTAEQIRLEVFGPEGAISAINVELDNITQLVKGVDGKFTEVSTTLDGLTITDPNGKTKINGSAIYTNNLYVKAANITGTLVAGELQGDTIQLFDDDGNYAASFTINTASTADYKLDIKAEAIAITTEEPGAYVFLGNADGAYFQLAGTRAYFGAHVRPDSDGGYNLGGSSYRWNDIYATNDVIQTSDKKKKKNISYTLDKFDVFFDGLMPGTYQMIDGKRDHVGLVAQDVETNLEKCSISTTEFAGFVKAEREDGNGYDYGLRYGEFVALLIDQVQKLKIRVNTLEDKHGSKKSA